MLDLSDKVSLYTMYRIKKSNGKYRVILAPCDELKKLQRKLMRRLNKIELSPFCFGFRKKSSTKDAAKIHTDKDWIVTLDIKDFFPSINTEMLDFLTGYEKEIATLNGCLVQGSPCSPVISNIVFKELDDYFSKFFKAFNITYSRYADDITLSGYDHPDWRNINHVKTILRTHGFEINAEKTKLMFKDESQNVLGIQVNDGLSINRKTRKQLRAAIHQGNVDTRVVGMLSYVEMVNKKQSDKLRANITETVDSTVERSKT